MRPNPQIQKQSAWNKLIIAIPCNPVIILKTIFTNVDRERRCLYFADLVTFTEEILNGKLHFMCSDMNALIILFLTEFRVLCSVNFHYAGQKLESSIS